MNNLPPPPPLFTAPAAAPVVPAQLATSGWDSFGAVWNSLGPIQSMVVAFLAALMPAIKANGIPTTVPGWVAIIGPAIVAVAALHTTAPRHQNPR
jgi:hypothetical protein